MMLSPQGSISWRMKRDAKDLPVPCSPDHARIGYGPARAQRGQSPQDDDPPFVFPVERQNARSGASDPFATGRGNARVRRVRRIGTGG